MQAVNISPITRDLAELVTKSLIQEVQFTPKPGLVDLRGSGSHKDMDKDLFIHSAETLTPYFEQMAQAGEVSPIGQELRERIASIGREAEKAMYRGTNGVNTHKGAIWTLGLLVTTAAQKPTADWSVLLSSAGYLAGYTDRFLPKTAKKTNGIAVKQRYQVIGAKEEAETGFPHLRIAMKEYEQIGNLERVLLQLLASVEDTCILHRGDWNNLVSVQNFAKQVLSASSINDQITAYQQLEEYCLLHQLSPGGSADLFAATLFLINREKNQDF